MDTEKIRPVRISRMDALIFAIVLEEVLLQMRVHGTYDVELTTKENSRLIEGSTELRLARKTLDNTEQMQYEKLVRDRKTVRDTIRRTLVEVAEHGVWNSLQQELEAQQESIFLAVARRKDHDKLKTTYGDTYTELTANRNQWISNLRNADHKIALLRDKYKDQQLNAHMRLRYAELWLSARLEAQELRLQNERKRDPPPRPDYEQRVHEEIIKAIELQIQEREKAIEFWKDRYATDIVNITERLAQKRWQLAVTTAKREDMQKLYDLHEGEMRAWRSFKEQRAARMAREERIRSAATHIQAWWRGIMVRKALGPFKFLRNIKKSPSKSKKK